MNREEEISINHQSYGKNLNTVSLVTTTWRGYVFKSFRHAELGESFSKQDRRQEYSPRVPEAPTPAAPVERASVPEDIKVPGFRDTKLFCTRRLNTARAARLHKKRSQV
jgi:hypothetical protein